eukprot:TRINITY_DN4316_c0_g1_i1.p1 TRINITY_DN4316_c0_g1~~TRINITY_DN4316_c0_g1_i1.p1  ORF type:complete len:371 (+),score=72.53 TRINITY_DN4316_c0_g1_i1:37-1113(+)
MSRSLLDLSEIEFGDFLAEGRKGLLYNCTNRRTKEEYVVKITPHSSSSLNEFNVLSSLQHSSIIQCRGFFSLEDKDLLVLEKANSGDCEELIQKVGPVNEEVAVFIILQVADALNYLHALKLVHRDVKLENILLHDNNQVKLADFEFCCEFHPDRWLTQTSGTPEYQAPELQLRKYVGPECDAWSLGICLFGLVSGYFPFSPKELIPYYRGEKELFFPTNISPNCHKLISTLLSRTPNERVEKLRSIYSDPWILPHVGNLKPQNANVTSLTQQFKHCLKFFKIKRLLHQKASIEGVNGKKNSRARHSIAKSGTSFDLSQDSSKKDVNPPKRWLRKRSFSFVGSPSLDVLTNFSGSLKS